MIAKTSDSKSGSSTLTNAPSRRRRWFWLFAGLVLLALVIYALRPQPVAVTLGAVERQTLTVTVQEQGRTRAREPYTITAPVAGQLLRTPLREGDLVNSGQVIARIALAPEDQRTEAVIRAGLEAAQARATAAQSALQEAETLADRAEREAFRRRELFEQGLLSAEENDLFQQAHAAAQSRISSARASLRAAEAEVESARAQLLGIAEGTQSVLPVSAPVAGTVLQVFEKSERVIAAGTPLFQLSDGDALELVIDLLTQEAVRVTPGDRILISGWGGEAILEGVVRYIEPEAFTKFSALGVEEQRVNVIGELVGSNPALGAGYRIEAAIVVLEETDALTVPASALFRRGDGWHVFVLADEHAQLRAVTLGERSQTLAQVLDGLDAGEQVIVFPSDQVADGVAVSAANPE